MTIEELKLVAEVEETEPVTEKAEKAAKMSEPFLCKKCHLTGHMARDCEKSFPDITCKLCEKTGHYQKACWKNK